MTALVAILVPIVVTDAINPVLLAAVVYALGTSRPYVNSLSVLSGWFTIYFAAGLALALAAEWITGLLANPGPVDFGVQLLIGALLLWLGYQATRPEPPRSTKARREAKFSREARLSFGSAFLLGATINVIGLPFAIPYFAAIDQIIKADPGLVGGIAVLLLYNLLYVLPFAAMLVLRRVYREESEALFRRINDWMERLSNALMPILSLLLGAVLVADAVAYFLRGEPIIPVIE